MKKIIKIVSVIIISFAGFSFPQTLDKVNISGNAYFDSQLILQWGSLDTGTLVTQDYLDSANAGILKNFARHGYFKSSISYSLTANSEDSARINLNVSIDEGDPAVIREIRFWDPDSNSESLRDQFSFLYGKIFDKEKIEESINLWLSEMENSGYPFARVVIKSVGIDDDSSGCFADLTLEADKGIQGSIDKIEIAGNTSTKDYVIVRELRLGREQLYSQKLVDEFPERLNRLRFFEPVPPPEYYINGNDEGVLVLNVKEKQTNNFDGIIGYIPPAGEQNKGFVTGLVNISLRNLFGTGRAAAVRWQQFDRLSQEMQLRYLEPWVFNYPFNITAGLYQKKQDSSYIQRKFEGGVDFLATEDISAGIFINSESVIPSLGQSQRFSVYRSVSFTTGINLKIDTRDDPYAPLRGILLYNSYSFSRKKIYGPAEFITPNTLTRLNLQRIEIDFSFFYEMFTKQVLAVGVHGRELRGPSLEESDMFFLGGTNTLRGYREKQFVGSRLFWSNTEYRLLLTRRTFAFIFFDTGYYLHKMETPLNVTNNEAFKTGYGAGLSLETGIGVLAVSYAIATGENFSDGKIHFGIVNEF